MAIGINHARSKLALRAIPADEIIRGYNSLVLEGFTILRLEGAVTDPQSRISELERGIRRWRRAALALASVLALIFLFSGWLVVHAQVRAQQARREAADAHQAAVQAREEAEAQRRFLEKELLPLA